MNVTLSNRRTFVRFTQSVNAVPNAHETHFNPFSHHLINKGCSENITKMCTTIMHNTSFPVLLGFLYDGHLNFDNRRKVLSKVIQNMTGESTTVFIGVR